MKSYMIEDAKLVVHQSGDRKIDLATLKTNLLSALYSTSLKASEDKDQKQNGAGQINYH